MIPVINKPSKIIRKPATTIDDILNLFIKLINQTFSSVTFQISSQYFFHRKHVEKKLVLAIYLKEL